MFEAVLGFLKQHKYTKGLYKEKFHSFILDLKHKKKEETKFHNAV